MMDPSEKHSFEEQWKRVFEEASEMPPKSVWEGIEAHLDRDEDKIVPLLWWKSPKVWLAAASIAALLLVGGGIWYNNISINSDGQVAIKESIKTSTSGEKKTDVESLAEAKKQPGAETEDVAKIPDADVVASAKVPEAVAKVKKDLNRDQSKTPVGIFEKDGGQLALINEKVSSDQITNPKGVVTAKSRTSSNGYEVVKSEKTVDVTVGQKENAAFPVEESETTLLAKSNETASPQLLASVGVKELDVHVQKRYVFFRPAIEEELPVLQKNKKEYWAGVSFMPATFSPDIKVKAAPQSFSSIAIANQKATTGSSKEGVSYAYQTSGGVRISKHWSMELGVNYLSGNSSYEGGGYLLNLSSNGQPTNVLESAYAGISSSNKTQNSPSMSADKSNNLYINVSKDIRNDYRYLQMPVQAGFTLNPNGRWSYSLLGGLMANFFLRNELESASGAIITTTAADDVYKAVNLAATTGLRLNYKLSSKWRANLTGSYQKAIDSGIRSNQSLDSKPYLYGVSWGVRYSF